MEELIILLWGIGCCSILKVVWDYYKLNLSWSNIQGWVIDNTIDKYLKDKTKTKGLHHQ